MKYYVKSAGTSPDYDYRWIYLNPKPRVNKVIDKNDPDFVKNFFIKKDIDPDSCVIALIRNNDKHLCLLARFKTKYIDYQRRSIYNYLAIESENTQNDDVVKVLTNGLLKDYEKTITGKINKLIKITNIGYGFEVNDYEFVKNIENILYEKVNKYALKKYKLNTCQSNYDTKSGQISKDLYDKRKEISDNILIHLPDNQGILVLVSGNMSIESFRQVEGLAWGVSRSIEEDYWVDAQKDSINKKQDKSKSSHGVNENSSNNEIIKATIPKPSQTGLIDRLKQNFFHQ